MKTKYYTTCSQFECQIDFETDVNEQIVYWREENLSNYMESAEND